MKRSIRFAMSVWRFPAPDKRVHEVHGTSIGEQNKRVIEITCTRRK